jgi:cyclohexa-1,5-dienecarbonyl-CoA hydratase
MSEKLIEAIKKSEAVTELIIGPPPSNIISEALMAELMGYLEKIANDRNKKLIVLTGAGNEFSYGASIQEHAPDKIESMIPNFNLCIDKILSSPVPILAKVRGRCLGGGFEVAMACHLIFAEKTAAFALPEITLGVFPPPASSLLPIMIGDNLANEIILTGASKSGEELKNCNLVNQVFDNAQAMEEEIVKFIEKRIIPLSASSIRKATQAARTGIIERYRKEIKIIEKLYLKDLMSTHDAVEGITSFMENKRKPVWTNQ